MKIHKPTGKLLVSEAEVEAWFVDRMTADGWRCIKTDASKITRNSTRPAHQPGTLDYVCVRTWGPSSTPREGDTPAVFYIELKCGKAKTAKKRLAEQTATAAALRREGYEVCQVPDDLLDPQQYITDWYDGYMRRESNRSAQYMVYGYRFLRGAKG